MKKQIFVLQKRDLHFPLAEEYPDFFSHLLLSYSEWLNQGSLWLMRICVHVAGIPVLWLGWQMKKSWDKISSLCPPISSEMYSPEASVYSLEIKTSHFYLSTNELWKVALVFTWILEKPPLVFYGKHIHKIKCLAASEVFQRMRWKSFSWAIQIQKAVTC